MKDDEKMSESQMNHMEVMRYLKNMTQKLINLSERLKKVETKTQELGMGCGRAFEMCKEVITEMSEHQKNLNESLDEHAGIITDSTWM
jgi:predicted  nucleic acid-binding Zn-ribbon protein